MLFLQSEVLFFTSMSLLSLKSFDLEQDWEDELHRSISLSGEELPQPRDGPSLLPHCSEFTSLWPSLSNAEPDRDTQKEGEGSNLHPSLLAEHVSSKSVQPFEICWTIKTSFVTLLSARLFPPAQCWRACTEMHRERQNKTWKAKDVGENLRLHRILWPHLNVRSLSTFANAAVLMFLPFNYIPLTSLPESLSLPTGGAITTWCLGNSPQAGIACQPQPSQTCHLPWGHLGTTSLPFLLWRCHSSVVMPALCTALREAWCTSPREAWCTSPLPLSKATSALPCSPPGPWTQGTVRMICSAAGQLYANTGDQPPHSKGKLFFAPGAPTTGLSAFHYQRIVSESFYYLFIQ